jgi:pyruvate dehydrogenase E2 component (dihydrolipoamide acetyltransferase)
LQLARESSIALADVQGTGPRGRILAADVVEFVPSAAAPAVATEASAAAPAAAAASVAGVDFTDLPLDQAKQVSYELIHLEHYFRGSAPI